jgi:hypothetical protein
MVGAAVVVAGVAEAPMGRDELRDFSGDLLSAAMKGWRVILPTYCRRDAALNVASITTPKLGGRWYYAVIAYALVLSGVYGWQLR